MCISVYTQTILNVFTVGLLFMACVLGLNHPRFYRSFVNKKFEIAIGRKDSKLLPILSNKYAKKAMNAKTS